MAKRNAKTRLVPVREPNGRLSRSTADTLGACSPAEVKRLRDAALAGMRHPEWGTVAGRLFLEGKLDAPEFEAAKRWGRLSAAATAIIRAPRAPGASTFVQRSSGHEPDPDSEQGRAIAERERLVAQEFAEAHGALLGAGMLAEAAVRHVCEDERELASLRELESLRCGLSWLALHWGLTHPEKNVRRVK